MRAFELSAFGIENLRAVDLPEPTPGPGQVLIDIRAISLNYRDLLVVRGQYNPKLRLPAIPISDGAGVVAAVGAGVTRVRAGDRVIGSFVADWIDGPFRGEYLATTLGTPGPGLAAERVVLPEAALLRIPDRYDFAQAAAFPIAALTAWSALVTEGRAAAGQSVLTLGTGGVSIFALQIAKALGCRVAITSSSDEKLERAKALGAEFTVNYRQRADWDRAIVEWSGGGADVTVECGGIATLDASLRATRPGGLVALIGAVTGLTGPVNMATCMMKRIRIAGILVDCRRALEELLAFANRHGISPVIGRHRDFAHLPSALAEFAQSSHFGKVVLER